MKNYKLENKIREALPRLKELTKGCVVVKDKVIFEVVDDKKSLLQNMGDFSIIHHEKANKKDFEIIGHPIKLNDVLEYTGNKFYQEGRRFMYGALSEHSDKGTLSVVDYILLEWDLSSVFLADQNDELKKFLNDL
jgi:hypothetical protein